MRVWDVNAWIFFFFARRCLAFISQRCTGVWTAAASAERSLPALVSRTASGMRKTSGAVSGKSPCWTRGGVWRETFFSSPCRFITNCLADWVKRDQERSVTPVCSWWNDGKSYPWEPRRTGTMWVWSAELMLWLSHHSVVIRYSLSNHSLLLLHQGRWRQRRPQPEDNLQAQKDQVHLQESPAQPDQQAEEGAEKKQWVLCFDTFTLPFVPKDWIYVTSPWIICLQCLLCFAHQIQTPTAPPPVPLRLSLPATATCQMTAQTRSSARDPAAPLFSHFWT